MSKRFAVRSGLVFIGLALMLTASSASAGEQTIFQRLAAKLRSVQGKLSNKLPAPPELETLRPLQIYSTGAPQLAPKDELTSPLFQKFAKLAMANKRASAMARSLEALAKNRRGKELIDELPGIERLIRAIARREGIQAKRGMNKPLNATIDGVMFNGDQASYSVGNVFMRIKLASLPDQRGAGSKLSMPWIASAQVRAWVGSYPQIIHVKNSMAEHSIQLEGSYAKKLFTEGGKHRWAEVGHRYTLGVGETRAMHRRVGFAKAWKQIRPMPRQRR